MKILFDNIDEPGLNTLAVYERRGGYQALRKALAMPREAIVEETRSLGHPRPRRRRLPDGPEGLVPAEGRYGQVPGLQRRRVRAGTFKDRELMQKSPHMLIEGIVIATYGT